MRRADGTNARYAQIAHLLLAKRIHDFHHVVHHASCVEEESRARVSVLALAIKRRQTLLCNDLAARKVQRDVLTTVKAQNFVRRPVRPFFHTEAPCQWKRMTSPPWVEANNIVLGTNDLSDT